MTNLIKNTYETLGAARQHAKKVDGVRAIHEIDSPVHGHCYVCSRCNQAALEAVLARREPKCIAMRAEIGRIVDEHDPLTTEERAAEEARIDAELDAARKCERCGVHVPKDSYSQEEWRRWGGSKVRVTVHYCAKCEALLKGIGAGEYSEMESRAGSVPSIERETKED